MIRQQLNFGDLKSVINFGSLEVVRVDLKGRSGWGSEARVIPSVASCSSVQGPDLSWMWSGPGDMQGTEPEPRALSASAACGLGPRHT